MKRRGKFFLSPVPHPKALAWPQSSERATPKPTPICTCSPKLADNTHPMGVNCCYVFDDCKNCQILGCQTQSVK